MAVAELKQAISQPSGELNSELPKEREAVYQPHSQLSAQVFSELPVAEISELLSEPFSESPSITSNTNSTLTNTPVSEEALAPPSELVSESLSTTPQLDVTDVTLTQAIVSEEALAAPSELVGESLSTTPQLDVTLTQATVSDSVLAPNNKEVAAQNPSRLTGAALARRLSVAPGSISRNKQKENFAAWTSIHDPDGLSWEFDGQTFQRVSSSPVS